MAKVARIAEAIPIVPPCENSSMLWKVPFVYAATASDLLKPHQGAMLAMLALSDTSAEIVNVRTETASRQARTVCTMPAFFTPMMFSVPKRIRIAMAKNISPIHTSKPAI